MKKLAVVGATGLVGQELLALLKSDPKTSALKIDLFASQNYPDQKVLALDENWERLREADVIFNMASSETAQALREKKNPQQIVIDNSSAFRMDPEVPLVVPEINSELLAAKPKYIANPNCTTILLTLPLQVLKPLGLKRVIVATYQSASGAGKEGLEELRRQASGDDGGDYPVFGFPLHQNILSHNSRVRPEGQVGSGYNEEEWKVIEETRKILQIRHLPVSATCMRVPTERAHVEAVTVDLEENISLAEIRDLFLKAPGIRVVDNWTKNHFPMPLEAQKQGDVLVGRLRLDSGSDQTLHFILAGDQLLKGAALNAYQIYLAYLKYDNQNAS
jgi:aspartate-semialdehyde dehydrogenase